MVSHLTGNPECDNSAFTGSNTSSKDLRGRENSLDKNGNCLVFMISNLVSIIITLLPWKHSNKTKENFHTNIFYEIETNPKKRKDHKRSSFIMLYMFHVKCFIFITNCLIFGEKLSRNANTPTSSHPANYN